MKLVFSFGGSVLAPDDLDKDFINRLASFLTELLAEHAIGVVVGGGAPARRRIAALRESGGSEAECDYEGILATRENARALVNALVGKAFELIPESIKEAVEYYTDDRVLVMGGTEPGHSTDAVAVLLAEWIGAVFINASNVDAVYDKNPKKFKDAKPLKEIRIDDLIHLLGDGGVKAGEYPLFDPVALKIMKRSRIRTVILDGRDFDNINSFINGEKYRGTLVVY
jgi:uridylate kinase